MLRRTASFCVFTEQPGDPRLARRRTDERRQHVDRARLAGAVRAQQAEEPTARNREIDAVHRERGRRIVWSGARPGLRARARLMTRRRELR